MPDAREQSESAYTEPLKGLAVLLRLGAFLPVLAGLLAFGLVLISGHRHKGSQPTPPEMVQPNQPIQLVAASQENFSSPPESATGPLREASGQKLAQPPTLEGTVRSIPNWQPDISLTAQPQTVASLVQDGTKSMPEGIRQVQAEQSSKNQQPARVVQFTLSQVDAKIESGNFSFAQEILRDVHPSATSLLKIQIELRMALCAELLGQPREALRYYRMVMQSPLSQGLADAATLSAARVLVDQGKHDLAAAVLLRLLIQREQLMAPRQRGELLHGLASCLTPDSSHRSLLHPDGWVIPRATLNPIKLMAHWDHVSQDTTRLASPQAELNVRKLTASADGIYVSCHHSSVSVISVIQSIADAAQLKLDIDQDTVQILSERTSPVACREFPLDVFLDSLCVPLQISWAVEDGTLRLWMPQRGSLSKKRTEQFQIAQRFLRLAVTMAQEHENAALSYLHLGVTYAELGRVDRAVRYFQTSMEQYPRSTVRAAARFNLGKARLINGERDDALKEFYRTVDHVAGPEIDAAAYMFIGRILMENDLPRDAVTPLARAVDFATGNHQEADAVVLLASAYLLHGQMEAANTVLDDHSEAFRSLKANSESLPAERRHLVQQGAMLSSLARFWGSRGSSRLREGTKLISSLASLRIELMFGDHNSLLVGAAYGAIGMENNRNAILQAATQIRPEFPLQNRMRLILAGRSSVDQWLQKDLGKLIFSSADRRRSVATVPALVELKSKFTAAERAYRESRFQECVTTCESIHHSLRNLPAELVGTESELAIRRENLELLGKSHQALGNHAQAIRFLTGVAEISEQDSSGPKFDQVERSVKQSTDLEGGVR